MDSTITPGKSQAKDTLKLLIDLFFSVINHDSI